MTLPAEYIVENPSETEKIAADLKDELKPGTVVALIGNLGSGKTFFVQAFCKLFGITNAVSPTFTIANMYDGEITIQHLDFYRIKKVNELYDIGIDEYTNNNQAVTFIEWADLFEEVLPDGYVRIEISLIEGSQRKITVSRNE